LATGSPEDTATPLIHGKNKDTRNKCLAKG